jgi:hypothetical protein
MSNHREKRPVEEALFESNLVFYHPPASDVHADDDGRVEASDGTSPICIAVFEARKGLLRGLSRCRGGSGDRNDDRGHTSDVVFLWNTASENVILQKLKGQEQM